MTKCAKALAISVCLAIWIIANCIFLYVDLKNHEDYLRTYSYFVTNPSPGTPESSAWIANFCGTAIFIVVFLTSLLK